jgi:hypothetical protein
VLAGVLLDVVKPPGFIDKPMNRSIHRNRLGYVVQYSPLLVVSNIGHRHFASVKQELSHIMDLSSTGGIEGSAIENDNRPSFDLERFHYAPVKLIKERVVVIKTIRCHFVS